MKQIINKFTNSVIIVSIISIILGLLFIIYPDISIKTIGLLIATYMLIHGIIICIFNFQTRKLFYPVDSLFIGLISIMLGVIILLKPTNLTILLTIILGVYILSNSITNIRIAIDLKGEDIPWIMMLIIGIIDLLAGIIIIINPFEASISLTIFIGIMLIVHAICNMIDIFTLKLNIKKIKKYLETN